METKEDELRKMKLHESLFINNWTHILRVIGGWIYQFDCPPDEGGSYCAFVPETKLGGEK